MMLFDFAIPPEIPCDFQSVKWLKTANCVAAEDLDQFQPLRTLLGICMVGVTRAANLSHRNVT